MGNQAPGQRLDLSVPTGSRSIPIFWRVYAKRDISEGEGSQNLIEEAFLREFLDCLHPRTEVVLLADRGFGRTEFFRFLESIRLSFILRVKGVTWICPGFDPGRRDRRGQAP